MQCFFHLRRGAHFIADEHGVGIADVADARFEVARVIEDFLAQAGNDPDRWKGWTIEMADECGTIIFTLALESSQR